MGFHPGSGTALLALALTGTAARGAEDDASGEPAFRKCRVCLEGKKECPTCQGAREVDEPCRPCKGKGGERCINCNGGWQRCHLCGGSGRDIDMKVTGGGTVITLCPRFIRCKTCSGTTTVGCKKCGGAKVGKVECTECDVHGKVSCDVCGGKGKLPVAPRPVDPELIKSRAARARAALEKIVASEKSLKALRGKIDSAREKASELERNVDSLRKAMGDGHALRAEAALLAEKWSACVKSGVLVVERLKNAEMKAPAGLDAARSLEEMLRRLDEPVKQISIDRTELSRCEVVSEACRVAVTSLGSGLEGLERVLEGCSQQIDRSDAAVSERRAKEEQQTRETELLDSVFASFRLAAVECARQAALPEVEILLLPSTGSSNDLHALVNYLDTIPPEAGALDEAVPTDAALERLPLFVTLLFGKVPGAGKIQVTIDRKIAGDTGHEARRTIQSFTMKRRRWGELVTGQHKDNWGTLLSMSNPAPPYPRPRSSKLMDGWPLVILLSVLAFSLSVVCVARSRMMN